MTLEIGQSGGNDTGSSTAACHSRGQHPLNTGAQYYQSGTLQIHRLTLVNGIANGIHESDGLRGDLVARN